MTIRTATLPLADHQLRLLTSPARRVVLQGGYGSGKTFGGAAFLLAQGWRNGGAPVLGVEPTYRQIEDVMVRRLDALCRSNKIGCRWYPSKKLFCVLGRAPFNVFCRSAELPENLEGIEASSAWIDEWEHCSVEALQRASSRVRIGRNQRIAYTGTAEGFGPAYEWLLAKQATDTELITVGTRANKWLAADYEVDLRGSLGDESFVAEKVDGLRTAKEGRVYSRFSRAIHCRQEPPQRGELQLACDFNVGFMHWLMVETNASTKSVHVVKELILKGTTTDQAAKLALEECRAYLTRRQGVQHSLREVFDMRLKAFCDAAGNSRSTRSTETDTALLRQAGFNAITSSHNPRIADRVNTVQVAFRDKRVTIDLAGAPTLVRNLENQTYKNGEPDKTGDVDHAIDALGYLLHLQFPIVSHKANEPPPVTPSPRSDQWGVR